MAAFLRFDFDNAEPCSNDGVLLIQIELSMEIMPQWIREFDSLLGRLDLPEDLVLESDRAGRRIMFRGTEKAAREHRDRIKSIVEEANICANRALNISVNAELGTKAIEPRRDDRRRDGGNWDPRGPRRDDRQGGGGYGKNFGGGRGSGGGSKGGPGRGPNRGPRGRGDR